MKQMIHTDSSDPKFRYEGLAREAFQCNKNGDPFGLAAQDHYYSFFIKEPQKGKRALTIILAKLIDANKEHELVSGLKKEEEKVWQAETQEDFLKIIDNSIEILRKID